MNTRFESSFLAAIVVATEFKPKQLERIAGAMVMLALKGLDFTAADIPDDISQNNTKLPGLATGRLIQAGVITVVDRVKSPDKKAHGRKLNVLRLVNRGIAVKWLVAHGFSAPEPKPERPALVLCCQ